jgi:hypothetical protein
MAPQRPHHADAGKVDPRALAGRIRGLEQLARGGLPFGRGLLAGEIARS